MTSAFTKKNLFAGGISLLLIVLIKMGKTNTNQVSDPNPSPSNHVPLNITVSPDDGVYSLSKNVRLHDWDWWPRDKHLYCVRFCVSNPVSTPCAIGVYSDCYGGEWKTDNTNVAVWDWACDANFEVMELLESTNVYSKELPIRVSKNIKPGNVSFRMCFTPFNKTKMSRYGFLLSGTNLAEGDYWSNEITIEVVP